MYRGRRPAAVGASSGSRGGFGEAGMVSVEIALALPLLMAVVLIGAWILHVGQTQARLTDAARAAAREAARGADEGGSVLAAQQVLPGAQVALAVVGGEVTVTAVTTVDAPSPWLASLSKRLEAHVVTRAESP